MQSENLQDKDFDSWNNSKKLLNENGKNKFYHPRDVWWCSLGVNIGNEQDGTGEGFLRPVVIVKSFSKNVCLVVPLTTSIKKNPYHLLLGEVSNKESFAIFSQIRLVDTKRLIRKVCVINKENFENLKNAVRKMF